MWTQWVCSKAENSTIKVINNNNINTNETGDAKTIYIEIHSIYIHRHTHIYKEPMRLNVETAVKFFINFRPQHEYKVWVLPHHQLKFKIKK